MSGGGNRCSELLRTRFNVLGAGKMPVDGYATDNAGFSFPLIELTPQCTATGWKDDDCWSLWTEVMCIGVCLNQRSQRASRDGLTRSSWA